MVCERAVAIGSCSAFRAAHCVEMRVGYSIYDTLRQQRPGLFDVADAVVVTRFDNFPLLELPKELVRLGRGGTFCVRDREEKVSVNESRS